jgi:hypothetical protein
MHTPDKWVSDLTEQVLDHFRQFSQMHTLGILDHFRHFRHFSLRHLSQSGMAYVAILVLLAILSTLGFGFIFKVGTQTSATMTRSSGMQAHYLAESAATHAMWRLLNESDFPASEDTYYMHSLAGGRYGYKVRRHTDTTFATIATVGAVGDNVVHQSYVLYVVSEQEDVIDVLFVVNDPSNPTGQEQLRKSLMEEWGYMVTLIDQNDSQADYDNALANADVAYVSEEIYSNDVNTKLTGASIGVVNEEIYLADELKFTSGNMLSSTRDQIEIVDNTHYITLPFSTGWLTFLDSSEDLSLLDAPYAAGMRVLAKTLHWGTTTNPSLATLEFGADLYGSGTAAGRRVHLPFGAGSFDFEELNADGQTIMRRAIEWGAEPSLVAHMKRRPIEITNTGSVLVDYQVLVTLTTGIMGSPYSHVNSDGSDIRFSDGAGTLFNYWIESWDNAGTSKIWVNVPSIPAGTSTIYLHYGNGTLRNASNGLATFLFFDDFEDHSAGVFADGWLPADTYQVQDDSGLKVLDDDVSGSGRNVTAQHPSWDDVAVRQRFRSVDGAVSHAGVFVRYADDSNEVYGGIVSNTTAEIWDRIGGGWSMRGGTWTIPDVGTSWHVQELRVAGTTAAELYIDDAHIGNGTLRVGSPSTGTSGFWSQYNRWGYRDWHLVRKYASPEPSTSVGDQE